ncbi:MAG: N-acetylmuramoyl-L-alanine amidase, partial [Candidatus Neomarinimicrobiota bacterium]
MKKYIVFWIITITCLTQSCSFYGRRRGPTEWYRIPKPDYTIPEYAQFLKGLKICLDPGHGGDAHIGLYKRGPTGVREAEMNLRVAFYLRDFLEKAGAQVILTRDGDFEIDLDKRAEVATLTKADIFISLHHNATDNPRTNYASTWYHGDADFRPVSLDLARYIQQSLVDYLRLPNQLPAGLLSDYLMYPDGFGVLRHLTVPGILLESSFFSNPKEEKLLAKPAYNRLEAYAIFLGIARWAAAGIPTVILREPHPDTTITSKQPTICLQIRDGLHKRKGSWMLTREQYFSRQVTFFLDDSTTPFLLDRDRNLIFHTPEKPLLNGWHTAQAEVTNYFGNHNLPRIARFRIAGPACYLYAQVWCDRLPADGLAFTGISTFALDSDSLAVADDDTIGAMTDYGRLMTGKMPVRAGKATFYLQAAPLPGTANLKFATGTARSALTVAFSDTNTTLVEGFCLSRPEQTPLENVNVTLLPDSLRQFTNSDGVYFFPQITPGEHYLQFLKNGYFSQNRTVRVSDGISNIDTLNLQKVFGGVLHDYIVVLDPRFGGQESGTKISPGLNSAQLNL